MPGTSGTHVLHFNQHNFLWCLRLSKSPCSSQGNIWRKASWGTLTFSYKCQACGLNQKEGRFTDWRISSFSPHDITWEMPCRVWVWPVATVLTPTRQEDVVSGERSASPTTSCSVFPLHLPTATAVTWRMSRVMSLPFPFRTCLWSCSQWIWLTLFQPAASTASSGSKLTKFIACKEMFYLF